MRMPKRYNYKVYSATGTYLATWLDAVNDPSFRVVINGGFVEMNVRLARKTNDFGETLDVALGNEVQLWCFDDDQPNGTKVFSGYISRYDPVNDGPEDYIQVYMLGWHTRMVKFIHEDSLGTTGISYNQMDPGEIAEDVINKGQYNGLPITWDESTLQKCGMVVSYNFQANTIQECIDKVVEFAPFGWYWWVDANKKLNLHPKNIFPIHTFTIGKQVFYISPQKRIENVINRVYFVGGVPQGQSSPLYGRYDRPASIQNYGLHSQKYSDSRVTLQSTMDTIAENILDKEQEIEVRTVIRVKDNRKLI